MKYILKIDSYEGDTTERFQYSRSRPTKKLYAIILIPDRGGAENPGKAEIIDDGYRSYDEAKEAWKEAI